MCMHVWGNTCIMDQVVDAGAAKGAVRESGGRLQLRVRRCEVQRKHLHLCTLCYLPTSRLHCLRATLSSGVKLFLDNCAGVNATWHRREALQTHSWLVATALTYSTHEHDFLITLK